MNFLKTKKSIALVLSAVVLGSTIIGGTLGSYGINAVTETEPVTEATETTESEIVETKENEETSTVLWKAELSEYDTNFSLMGYEKVEVEDEDEVIEKIA